jgi:hypothetical protein
VSLSAHLQALSTKHQKLSEEVEVMQRNPAADTLKIADLKKEKLRIKQKISRLSLA